MGIASSDKWKTYDSNNQDLPQFGRWCLVRIRAADNMPEAIVAGFLKRFGDSNFWVLPGIPRNTSRVDSIISYCDCLGDDFIYGQA